MERCGDQTIAGGMERERVPHFSTTADGVVVHGEEGNRVLVIFLILSFLHAFVTLEDLKCAIGFCPGTVSGDSREGVQYEEKRKKHGH